MVKRYRQQHPKQMRNYKSYKRFLRLEFGYTCAYCDLTEHERGGSCNFGCDHYAPQSLFPELATDYNNLLYACSRCNSYKQDYWPTENFNFYILNPFETDVAKHLDKSLPKWDPKTFTGLANIQILRLTSEGKIAKRENRAKAEKLLAASKDKLTEALNLQALAKTRGAKDVAEQLAVKVEELRGEIEFWAQQLTPELNND